MSIHDSEKDTGALTCVHEPERGQRTTVDEVAKVESVQRHHVSEDAVAASIMNYEPLIHFLKWVYKNN